MPYGNSKGIEQEINRVKSKLAEERPGLNVDSLSQNDMTNIVIDEINKNPNIDPIVKEKINRGDIDGLKQDIINYLSNNKSGDGTSDVLVNMLKNNDMDGLKNQLMGMLFGGMNQQKKNEINNAAVNNPVPNNPIVNSSIPINGIPNNPMPNSSIPIDGILNNPAANNPTSNNPNTFAGLSSLLGGLDSSGGLMGMLMNGIGQGNPDDSRIALLNSMKPFLSDVRQKGIDDAIRIISMIGYFEKFRLR